MRVANMLDYQEHLPGSGLRAQRRWVAALIATGALLAGVLAAVGARAADTERIGHIWTHAALDDNGRAQVAEVIDYDFGVQSRHGILRDIPDIDRAAPPDVESPTAPDDVVVTATPNGATLRIGDPDVTISGRHRYRIEYWTDGIVEGSTVSWNAVGVGWAVPIGQVEIHLTAPHYFEDLRCDQGSRGSTGGCTVNEVEPGHLVVETSGLSAHEGVTVSALRGAPTAETPTPPSEPTGPAGDPGFGWLFLGLLVAAAALALGFAAWWILRRLGRERVWSTSAVSAAMGPGGSHDRTVELLDHRQLAELATTEFAAPKDLTPAQGGVVFDEQVRDEHKTAWLIERAIEGDLDLESAGDKPVLVRTGEHADLAAAPIIDEMFNGRRRLPLGVYNAGFAEAWGDLEEELERWRRESGLWDPRGRTRRLVAFVLGIVLAISGVAIGAGASAAASRWGSPWLLVAVLGAALAGTGFALLFGSWELRIRTPEGSSKWLQVESFRRFLASSEGRHAEAAARMGLLREYTAWAVSLRELDHWSDAVGAAATSPGADFGDYQSDLDFLHEAEHVAPKTAMATATAPRSSGNGGDSSSFGGGGTGSGGGGGGGSSW